MSEQQIKIEGWADRNGTFISTKDIPFGHKDAWTPATLVIGEGKVWTDAEHLAEILGKPEGQQPPPSLNKEEILAIIGQWCLLFDGPSISEKQANRLARLLLGKDRPLAGLDKELVEAQDAYISFLTGEIQDVISFAVLHGWAPSRYEVGKELRDAIAAAKSKIQTPHNSHE